MKPNKLYFDSTLKTLENRKNILVWFFPWNGIIRNDCDEVGEISTRVMDKLNQSKKLRFIGNGTGLLNHEKYYQLKDSVPAA